MLWFDNLWNNTNILILFLYFILVLHRTSEKFSVSSKPLSNIYFLHFLPQQSLRYLYLPMKLFQDLWLQNISGIFRIIFGNFTVILILSIYFPLSFRFVCRDYLFMVSSDIFDQTPLMKEGISLASSCLLCFLISLWLQIYILKAFFLVFWTSFPWNGSFYLSFFFPVLLYIFLNVIAA